MTDTVFLGRVGTVELGALALADTITELWTVPAIGLADAMQIMVARRAGEGRERDIGRLFNRAVAIALVTSVALVAVLKVGSPHVVPQLVESAAVATAIDDFLQVGAYGIVFMALSLAFTGLYVGIGRPAVIYGATVVLVATNLALSWILIFGRLGLPALGMEGAGLAFTGAELATLVFLTAYTSRRGYLRRYGLFREWRRGGTTTRSLVRVSSPAVLQGLLEVVRWIAFFLIVEQVGEDALALSNVAYALLAVALIPSEAVGEGVYTLVSRLIGGRRSDEIGDLIRAVLLPVYLLTLPVSLIALVFPELVLAAFSEDAGAIEGAEATVRVVGAAMTVVIPAEIWLSAVFGTGDTDAAFAIEFLLTTLVVSATWAGAVVLGASLPFVWLSIPFASAVALLLSYAWVRGGYWKRRRI